jgi:hypothetical protein
MRNSSHYCNISSKRIISTSSSILEDGLTTNDDSISANVMSLINGIIPYQSRFIRVRVPIMSCTASVWMNYH